MSCIGQMWLEESTYQDRLDVSFAVKELSRQQSCPIESDGESLKRLGRYLIGAPRLVQLFRVQGESQLVTYVDTNFAGCLRTRKSTSGGMIMHGGNVVKHWSSAQSVIALSSGEAEYYGLVKGGSNVMGIKAMCSDLGVMLKGSLVLATDASAAKAIAQRRGLGKVRHIEVNQLWLQEHVSNGIFEVINVTGSDNPADLLTKHLCSDDMAKHLSKSGFEVMLGRHELVPALTSDHDSHA